MENIVYQILKDKNQAMCEIKMEDEHFESNESSFYDDDIIIISSRSNNGFTERLIDNIKEYEESKMYCNVIGYLK